MLMGIWFFVLPPPPPPPRGICPGGIVGSSGSAKLFLLDWLRLEAALGEWPLEVLFYLMRPAARQISELARAGWIGTIRTRLTRCFRHGCTPRAGGLFGG